MCVLSYVKKLDMINKDDVSINENIDIEYLQYKNFQKINFSDLIIITSILMSYYGFIYFIFNYFKTLLSI